MQRINNKITMAAKGKEKFNIKITSASLDVESAINVTAGNGTPNNHAKTVGGAIRPKNAVTEAANMFKRKSMVTALNRALTDLTYTNRGDYKKKKKLSTSRLKAKYKDDPVIDYIVEHRVGLQLTPDEEIFLYECAFNWYNGQCINTSNPSNDYFLVNGLTGRRGDLVIGTYEDGEPSIKWREMADDFYKTKHGETRTTTKTAIAKQDDQTQNFKRMVSAMATDTRKRLAVSYLEQNEFGVPIVVERIIQPMTIETVTNNGAGYIVLHFADYFIYNDGNAITKYRPATDALMKAIQAAPKARAATLKLLEYIRMRLSAPLAKNGAKGLAVDADWTRLYNEKRKGKKTAYVVKLDLMLNTIIPVTSVAKVNGDHHDGAHAEFSLAVKTLQKGGVICDADGDDDFVQWFKDGKRPANYKTWADFYKKVKVTLYVVKDY